MDRCSLVMSVVFDNNHAFEDLSKEDTMKLLLVSKLSITNKNIIKYQTKYQVYHLFQKFDRNIVSLIFAKNMDDDATILDCLQLQAEILTLVHHSQSEFKDCFFRLLFAVYKEYIYGSLYHPHFERTEYMIMAEYENIFHTDDELYAQLFCHQHDPTHYMFNHLNSCYYDFYDMIEKDGRCILDIQDE